jgi:hypothetical protein
MLMNLVVGHAGPARRRGSFVPRRMPLAVLVSLGSLACEFNSLGPVPLEPMTLVAADGNGFVYTVDETTGTETSIRRAMTLHPFSGLPVPVGVITSLSWIPSVDELWLGTAFGGDVCSRCIYAFSPDATAEVPVRPLVEEVDGVSDFAVHPITRRIYTFHRDRGGYLFRVDPEQAVYTEVMQDLDEGSAGKGTTFSNEGLLYVAGDDRLTHIRLNLREVAQVGTFSHVGFPAFATPELSINSMTTRASDGVVFGILQDGGGAFHDLTMTYLVTIDLETAEVTNVGTNTNLLTALTWVPTWFLD